MTTITQDEIVETRTWSSGVEIVARINWSQIARLRRVLGLAGDDLGRTVFLQPSHRPTLVLHLPGTSKGASTRAA